MTTSTTDRSNAPASAPAGTESARRSRRARFAFGVAAALVSLLVAGIATEAVLAARDARRHAAPGERVELTDGRVLHLDVTRRGTGGPTLVLETGAGLPSSLWRPTVDAVLDAVEGPVTVVAYDRHGSAWSGPPTVAPTPDVVVADLREALSRKRLSGPYILVGHSIGAHYVRDFAATHPAEVVGIVLVDPRHEDTAARLPELAEAQAQTTRMLRLGVWLRPFGITRLVHQPSDRLPPGVARQVYALELHRDHLRGSLALGQALDRIDAYVAYHAADLGTTPVRIVSAGLVPGDDPLAGALADVMDEAHESMTALSRDASRHVVHDADHVSIVTNPDHARQLAAHVADLLDTDH